MATKALPTKSVKAKKTEHKQNFIPFSYFIAISNANTYKQPHSSCRLGYADILWWNEKRIEFFI